MGWLLAALLQGAVKGCVDLALVAVLMLVWRRAHPSIQHMLWLEAVLAFPVAAVLSVLPLRIPAVHGSLASAAASMLRDVALTVPAAPTQPAHMGTALPWRAVVAAAWALGAAAGIARALVGSAGVRAILRRAGLRGARVVTSAEVRVAFTHGWLRPVVVLPPGAPDAVLAHELAHVRRADWLTHRVAYLACCLFWFAPPVWVALRRLGDAQELACDLEALASGASPAEYARLLVEAMRSAGRGRAPELAFGRPARALERRVRFILSRNTRNEGSMRGLRRVVVIAAAALIVPLALVRCSFASTPGELSVRWPVDSPLAKLVRPFGRGKSPITGTWVYHNGVDISWLPGAPVRAAEAGSVSYARSDNGPYGAVVILTHSYGYQTMYAHLRRPLLVRERQTVKRGQTIGRIGDTGQTQGFQVHFSLFAGGVPVDPAAVLPPFEQR